MPGVVSHGPEVALAGYPPSFPLGQRGAFDPLSLFAGGYDGFFFDPSRANLYQTSDTSSPVTASGQSVGRVTDLSPNGRHATQATSSQRPVYTESGGYRYLDGDGADDRMATTFAPGSANSIVLEVDVPASLSTTQIICGGSLTSGTRFWLGVLAAGQVIAGVGSGTPSGSADIRNTKTVLGLTQDGTTVKIYQGQSSTPVYSGAQGGTIASDAVWLFSGNSAAFWFGGNIHHALVINRALSPAEYLDLARWAAQR